MKRVFTFMIGFLLLFLVGCGTSHNEASVETAVQYAPHEDKESNSSCDSIDAMLIESYPWRKAYAEFLWDGKRLNAEVEKQLKRLTEIECECFNPMLGLIFFGFR